MRKSLTLAVAALGLAACSEPTELTVEPCAPVETMEHQRFNCPLRSEDEARVTVRAGDTVLATVGGRESPAYDFADLPPGTQELTFTATAPGKEPTLLTRPIPDVLWYEVETDFVAPASHVVRVRAPADAEATVAGAVLAPDGPWRTATFHAIDLIGARPPSVLTESEVRVGLPLVVARGPRQQEDRVFLEISGPELAGLRTKIRRLVGDGLPWAPAEAVDGDIPPTLVVVFGPREREFEALPLAGLQSLRGARWVVVVDQTAEVRESREYWGMGSRVLHSSRRIWDATAVDAHTGDVLDARAFRGGPGPALPEGISSDQSLTLWGTRPLDDIVRWLGRLSRRR